MKTEVPLFGLGLQGKSPNISANKLINAYYEFHQIRDRTQVSIHCTPGLELFINQGASPWRGLHSFPKNSLLYGVNGSNFYSINNAGTITSLGTISTSSGHVDMSDDGQYIVIVDGQEIYTYDTDTPATPIAAVSDADRPASPNTCILQAGRILTDENNTGQFKGGALYDPTTWSALDFATAEQSPDRLIRIINYRGSVALMGDITIEFWQNVGGSGFPYTKIQGADIEYGLAARWSVGQFAGTYAFLANNREGQVFIAAFDGYGVPKRISNFELEHLINNYASYSDATGFGYFWGGHPMYQINFPIAGKSWLYDGSTQYWSELQYGASGRHRAEKAVGFLEHTIVSDYSNGNLYKLKDALYTDNGEAIHTILRGRHIFKDKNKVRFTRLEIGMEPGVGTTNDPQMMLRLSKDGGHSWGTQRFAPMGNAGEYTTRAIFRNMGSGRDIVPEITITDNVKRILTDATLIVDEGYN